ncbi:MAG TPA: cation:dicarboxylase symporter family transporter [Allosphingosinicella sp.]|uniref:dicarboxylate/amino acid:cation symporter n=1 Tax=Allosphingosinicella sp. TaxID=2823234 RepID=UPI002F273EF4
MTSPSPRIGARPSFILAGLALGIAAGILGPAALGARFDSVLPAAELIGGLWLDALRMTIVPLVLALVVTGMAGATATLAAGGIAARALGIFLALLVAAAVVTALIALPALALWSPDPAALPALQAGAAPAPAVPPLAQSIRGFVPVNIVAAAAEGAIVPLVLFALLLGLAVTRIAEPRRLAMLELAHAIADSMLVIVGWVLRLAPLGVAALAIVAGARLGLGIGAALATYVLIQIAAALALIALCYLAVALFGRVGPARFARAAAPAQAVAFSTQSSLASLPPMVAGAEQLALPEPVTGLVLPLAVATFKISAPVSALTVAVTLAHLHGVPIGPAQLVLAGLLAIVSTLSVVGLPGQVSFFAATAPSALALGAPIELLPLLLAIDTVPDMIRTVANVTADMAAAALVAARSPAAAP